ncbi:N-terminal methionine N(alpha)-acetyltransferase NatE [Malassezia equina]|uniref:Pre-mRNA-splicing factor CWC24 n=1 Tax=Malassezia equina TaxID=1381935 RepID=A0AAF0EBZ6_9BASI|nr:N-terminal methionine N(alpha)-acetyltransferase NatE [Malassezia equina]
MADDPPIVFRKRARGGARDVRKRELDAGADDTSSAVVDKKARVAESEAPASSVASRAPDRFGERSVHATERASGSAANDNTNQNDATRSANDWDVEEELRHFREAAPAADGTYRGLANYAKYTETRDDGASAKFKAKGPIKAPANVRTVTVVDYQPDVCKDYKETGYCGFGDTCKFLHDRSDYLAGWQMNSVGEAADARAGTFGADMDESDDEEIPFACLLCRQPFTDPIVTKCGHYFCARCAIARFAKTPKCFACGAKTEGLFQSATRVLERMRKRQESRAEARAEHRRMHGMEDNANELLDGVVVE